LKIFVDDLNMHSGDWEEHLNTCMQYSWNSRIWISN
jgi:hypothetical protein